ncbi:MULTISPECIES: hypothetical protein [unclassified Cupriavidus]|jgi:hypothetical protein|uniref:hypothetical protein n=1 Tax=unclassified Cupriavidus TaxID=2640874 RepID=UPI001C000D63|nr:MULTISPECIES: hypothetical protein [unclassified Cupriavidus]MCA3182895.1 hypothetical protein [Cupriavidus sp.]MCA3191471.1 hypothetical protein [Cupriavidus sp.]MCA3197437.1 hypothetical protein [Cupriavidus sp.]MCA3201768.1 hypothetical protein [Cupriavidus sp.]MCA3208080.1 hypothetical protein [Cupriavidus sp.]
MTEDQTNWLYADRNFLMRTIKSLPDGLTRSSLEYRLTQVLEELAMVEAKMSAPRSQIPCPRNDHGLSV